MKKFLLLCALLLAAFIPQQRASAAACTALCVQVVNDDQFSGTSNNITLTGVTAGNAFHVWSCYLGPTSISSATLNGSATGVQISTGAAVDSGLYTCQVIAMANATSGSNTVVVNYAGGTCGECFAYAEEWHGDATSSILETSNGAFVAGPASAPCGNLVTSNANDVIETMLYTPNSTAPGTPATYTLANNGLGGSSFYTAALTVSSTGTYNPTWTGNAFAQYVVCGAFKQTGGGGGNPVFNQLMLHAGLMNHNFLTKH